MSFKVSTAEVMTKAIADGSNVDILYWEIYGDVNNAQKPLAEGVVKDDDANGEFTLDLTLIIVQTYTFVFWAQVDREEGKEHYDVSDLRKVYIKTYADEKANDESRAAFFAVKELHVSGPIDEKIILRRPFSQLNIATTSYDTSLNLTSGLKVNTSEITVDGVANAFNTLTGKGEGRLKVLFSPAPTPHGEDDAVKKMLDVNGVKYHWLGMNYLIVNGDKDDVNVDILFDTTHGPVDLYVSNVPVKENFRTNIVGDLLTTDARFEVIVDENFDKNDIVVNK